jgi:hypothetical protein
VAIVPVESDQSAGIEGETWHQATERLRRFWFPSISSAQSFSSCESGPPVSRSACASTAPQPAASSRDTPTACCTNPETLDAFPASTRSRTRSNCSALRVIVIFLVAIPDTILSKSYGRHQKSGQSPELRGRSVYRQRAQQFIRHGRGFAGSRACIAGSSIPDLLQLGLVRGPLSRACEPIPVSTTTSTTLIHCQCPGPPSPARPEPQCAGCPVSPPG